MEGLPPAQDRVIILSKVLGQRRNGRLARLSDVIIEIEDGREVWAEARHETVAARSAHGDLTVSTVKHKACPCKSVCCGSGRGAKVSTAQESAWRARAMEWRRATHRSWACAYETGCMPMPFQDEDRQRLCEEHWVSVLRSLHPKTPARPGAARRETTST